jgi:hypothetical protein
MKTDIHILSYLAQFFLEWRIFQTQTVEKLETHFILNNVLPKIVPFVR